MKDHRVSLCDVHGQHKCPQRLDSIRSWASASVEMAPQVASRRSCTFTVSHVYPAPGRSHACPAPFASPSVPPSTWPAAAWASCADPQLCELVPSRCDRRWRRAARHRGWHQEFSLASHLVPRPLVGSCVVLPAKPRRTLGRGGASCDGTMRSSCCTAAAV